MDILILGAGVIGVTTAWRLAERGHRVTVLEQRPGPGEGTSRANAGLVTPSQAPPWNEPGVPRQALGWLREPDGALRIHPRAEPALWRWLLGFARHSRPRLHEAHARAILALARHSRQELDRIAAATGIAYDRTDRGILTIARDQASRGSIERNAAKLQGLGIACSLLDRAGCLALEPALAPIERVVAGGLHTPEDASGDIYKLVTGLAEAAARRGVVFRTGVAVERLVPRSGRLAGVVAGGETLTADAYVLALGTGSASLARQLGLRLPIYPVQGVSLTFDVPGWVQPPTMPVRDPLRRVATTPMGGRLRVAGMAILNGGDLGIDRRDVDALRRATAEIFPGAPLGRPAMEWSGLRPMTPDGPPIIGRTPFDNLLVNTGHGPLGWTLSCGSADVVADLVDGRAPAVPIEPFRIDRYRPGGIA
ncbi:MAG: D-amino acid dehydrogenase [Dongiaceae bacterium]